MANITELAVEKTTALYTLPPLRISIDNPNADAHEIWARVFPYEPWPDGASVQWAHRGFHGFLRGCYADFIYFKPWKIRVYLPIISLPPFLEDDFRQDPRKYLSALIHELVHLHGHHAHGRSFYRTQNRVRAILGLEPVWRSRRRPMPKGKKRHRTEPLPLWQEARP